MPKFKRKYAPYREYVAGIVQTGTAAPVVTVKADNLLRNLSPAAPVAARTGVGVYTVTKAGLFTSGKTTAFVRNSSTRSTVERTSADALTIRTFAADGTTAADAVLGAGGLLTDLVIQIFD